MLPLTARETRRLGAQDRVAALEKGASHPSPRPRPRSGRAAEVEDDRLLGGAFEVNERCLEMLVDAARQEPHGVFALVSELRDLLRTADPAVRRRAACRSFLLVDLEFGNTDWWHAAARHPSREARAPAWRGSFARGSGTQLARATLLLAWNSLRAARDPATPRLLLGMTPEVGELVASLRFDQIDHIAKKRFRFVRPRWDDRPAVWRRLLAAAREDDPTLMGQFNLHALQLLAGELLERKTPPPR